MLRYSKLLPGIFTHFGKYGTKYRVNTYALNSMFNYISRAVKPQTVYPYLDTETNILKGEKWKDIPGFEHSFMVSNLGRVKSLDRIVPHKRCETQFVKGRILRQNVKKHYNYYTKDHVVILQATLMLENKRHEFSVRRLVYAAFADPSVLHDSKRMIVAKDGDGYNARLSNLKEINNSEKQKMLLSKGRTLSALAYKDHSTFKPAYSRWKPVHKCDMSGNILETYQSIVKAASTEGFYEKGISNAARGRQKTYKGFKWEYADKSII
jgi:hypothetical protein